MIAVLLGIWITQIALIVICVQLHNRVDQLITRQQQSESDLDTLEGMLGERLLGTPPGGETYHPGA